ncbi:PepSY-associated TM helix domain-containing protein [Nostoc sp.]|uniref:PepSY-associated TM helix domain-containing protein n=1 Tax=Nostoc sp. TaxID=1180 RepID=UPI002FF5D30B
MNSKKLHNLVFILHRYTGLAVGLIAIIVGLTGSLLVFHTEIENFAQQRPIYTITPQGQPLPIEVVINTVKKTYSNQPDVTLQSVYLPTKPSEPMNVVLKTKENDWTENYVNPYTGAIFGNNLNLKSSFVQKFFEIVYPLHYSLLAGDWGYKFLGIIGLLMSFMSITGIILWPGWRKLISGFKIKWNAHPKRVNFDVHKVAGVITVVFLIFTFFTGFCWSFSEFVNPMIYTLTFSNQQQASPVSVPIAGKSPLLLKEQLKIAQAALPNGSLRSISFPSKPEEVLTVNFKQTQKDVDYDVYLDQYSGKVLRVHSSLQISLGDRIVNSFVPLHFGTFWGLPSRIFYVFVGLAPLVLFITSFVMWWYRYKKNRSPQTRELAELKAEN